MKSTLSILKALADRNRLRIMSALIDHNELCACQITELLDITAASASRHLSLLVNAELLDSRKAGRWVYFRLHSHPGKHHPMIQWLKSELDLSEEVQEDRRRLKSILSEDPETICRRQRGEKCCP